MSRREIDAIEAEIRREFVSALRSRARAIELSNTRGVTIWSRHGVDGIGCGDLYDYTIKESHKDHSMGICGRNDDYCLKCWMKVSDIRARITKEAKEEFYRERENP